MAKIKQHRRVYKKSRFGALFFILKLALASFLLFISAAFLLFIYYAKDLPRPEKFTERELAQSTKIFDRSGGVLLYEIYGEEKRTWVDLKNVSNYMKKAVIVSEDRNFYSHSGLDLKALLRAVLVDLRLGKPAQGGSTIVQQLIRSSFLTREKTIIRKTREIILALEMSRRYTKDQILEWYLNQIPFGSNAYGAEAASQTFFRKPISEISLAEAASLTAMIRAPSWLSPYGPNKKELLVIKNNILENMNNEGYITKEEMEAAKNTEVLFSVITQPIKAPHFTMYVKDYLLKKYGEDTLKRKGFKVYTTLDWELQQLAEEAVREGVEKNKGLGIYNAAMAAVSPKTGEVISLVGSANWFATNSYPVDCQPQKNCLFEPKFDVATLGERQPGSSFKPFVYAKSFEKGYAPETVLWDVATNFGVQGSDLYTPRNYDGKFRGAINLRNSLAQSLNIPSVKILYLAGIKESIDLAKKMGITTLNQPDRYGLALVLGGGEVKLIDMVSAFGVFATEGLRNPPVFVLKITDAQENIIEENQKTPQRVLDIEVARKINDILSDNEARAPIFGSRSSLYFENYQVAAKTGTTQNYKDAWAIGYTPSIVVGVWTGNSDGSPPKIKRPGIQSSGPIWRKFMQGVLLKYPKEIFTKPAESLTQKPILKGIMENPPHTILQYINKDDPLGDPPQNPLNDPQYFNWEAGIQDWLRGINLLENNLE